MFIVRFILIKLLIIIIPLPLHAGCDKGSVIVSGKPDYPPISWTRYDELTGFGYTLVEKIFNEFNIQVLKADPMPWKRVLHKAEIGELDIVIGVREITERVKYLDFIATPIIDSGQNIFFMKGAKIETVEDLPGKIGGALRGITFTKQFNKFATSNLEFEAVNTQFQNIKKLELGRIDYFIAPLLPTIHYIRKNNLSLNIQFIALPVFTVQEKIAFSKKSNCTQYLNKFEERIKKLHQQDFIYDLFDEQTQEWDVLEYLK